MCSLDIHRMELPERYSGSVPSCRRGSHATALRNAATSKFWMWLGRVAHGWAQHFKAACRARQKCGSRKTSSRQHRWPLGLKGCSAQPRRSLLLSWWCVAERGEKESPQDDRLKESWHRTNKEQQLRTNPSTGPCCALRAFTVCVQRLKRLNLR